MMMSPNKSETAVHGCHCPGDMAVHMREVLARPWAGVCVPLALRLPYATIAKHYFPQFLYTVEWIRLQVKKR